MWNLAQPEGHSSPSEEYDTLQNMTSALVSLHQVMSDLRDSVIGGGRIIENLQLYNNIQAIWYKIGLDGKGILFTLLKKTPNMTFDQIFDKVGGNLNDIIEDCWTEGIECNSFSPTTMSSGLFPRCFRYATSKGMKTKGFEDGVSKGIMFIFKTGGQLMSVGQVKTADRWKVPNWYLFQNYKHPSSSNGIRLTINHPGANPNIDEESLDISPGFHTVVALTSKEIIRLPWPYSDCTHVDLEMQKLWELIRKALGFVPTDNQAEDHSAYSQQECRSTCLQRLIFESCNCLDSKIRVPFNDIDPSHLCMILPLHQAHMFLEPEGYDKLSCFNDLDEFISQNCSFLHKIINDLACVERVKIDFTERKLRGNAMCDCPPACYTYEYEVSTSQSLWPASGYEMAYMWEFFIHREWNYNFGTCQEFTDCATFSNRKLLNSSECKVVDRENLRFVFTTKYQKNTGFWHLRIDTMANENIFFKHVLVDIPK